MTDQEKLMQQITANRFAMLELHLFLDSHPGDCETGKKLEEYRQSTQQLIEKYEAAYGPLNETPQTASRWAWISNPWPWELSKEDK
jgi:spore coat protein JB